MNSKKTNRRKFLDITLKSGMVAWIGAIIYPVFRFLIPPETTQEVVNSIIVSPLSEFPVNTSKIVRFGRKPVLVIRKKNGDLRALSATCTHLDCNVQYRDDIEQIWCACHNGFYNLEGKNIAGPPPKPLASFIVSVKNENVILSRGESS
jgi:Rieske Fe-S protein